MEERTYSLDNLVQLIKEANITYDNLAKAIGISLSSLRNYLGDRTTISLSVAIKLADYFAVPLDVIIGRCSPEQAEAILSDYGHHFMELRRADYEMHRFSNTRPLAVETCKRFEVPYPYNLFRVITNLDYEFDFEAPLTSDQEKGIEYALSTLSERESYILRKRFRDDKTLEQIGKDCGISGNRALQIVNTAIWKLRQPIRRSYILEGYKATKEQFRLRESEAERREQELVIREGRLKDFERYLDDFENELKAREAELSPNSPYSTSEFKLAPPPLTIEELDLSVRAYNCLNRAGIKTADDILKLTKDNKFRKVRNLGRKSWEEIVFKMSLYDYELPGWKDNY